MTFKRRCRNSFILIMPFLILIGAIFIGRAFAKTSGGAALVLAGTQMPSESVSVIFDELEGGTEEEIQSVIDELNIPEDRPGTAVFTPGIETKSKNDISADTPDDIAKLIIDAKTVQKNAKADGKIREVTYSKENATTTYKNVAVRNSSNCDIDIGACMAASCKLSISERTEPQVLIFHTHTTEAYEMLDRGFYSNSFPTRSSLESCNMVRVGNALCDSLSAAGYGVIHDKQIYDTSYSGSYARSRVAIEKYKKQYPSLQVIIDVHRDGIKSSDGTKTKPITTINGKKAAQIMIITGCESGSVKDFKGWRDNLNFAVQLQAHAETLYPGLMRPIFFCPRKYNMDTSPCGLLLEVGSDANTLDEAVYSASLVGNALASLLESYTKQ